MTYPTATPPQAVFDAMAHTHAIVYRRPTDGYYQYAFFGGANYDEAVGAFKRLCPDAIVRGVDQDPGEAVTDSYDAADVLMWSAYALVAVILWGLVAIAISAAL